MTPPPSEQNKSGLILWSEHFSLPLSILTVGSKYFRAVQTQESNQLRNVAMSQKVQVF